MKTFFLIFLTFIITGGVFGGGAYYLTNHKASIDKNSLNNQIGTLQAQLNELTQVNTNGQNSISSLLNSISDNAKNHNLSYYLNTANNYLLQYDGTVYGAYACSGDQTPCATLSPATAESKLVYIQPSTGIQNDGSQTISISVVMDNTKLTSKYALSFMEKYMGGGTDVLQAPTPFSLGNLQGFKIHGLIGSYEDFYMVSHNSHIYIFETGIGDASTQQWYQATLSTVIFTNRE